MTDAKQGDVWSYDYLWRQEFDAGIEHGIKPRPTALVATAIGQDGRTNLFMLAITSKRPSTDRLFVEVPEIERARAGLDRHMPLWIILDEYNHEFLETSYHLDPLGKIGSFSSSFSNRALAAFVDAAKARKVHKIPRSD